jgi:hypothetical protein
MFARIRIISGIFAILACMVVGNVSAQTTWYVATNGNDSANTGKNGWDDAFLTISNAVAKSASFDTILVGAGEYVLTATITIPSAKDIHLLGVAGPSNTVINGNYPAYEICGINAANGRIGGFTITNAYYNLGSCADGGGVYLGASAMMTNCILEGNYAGRYGGGALVYGGILSNCIARGNRAGYGGGVMARSAGQVLNCWIENNVCTNYGGGIYLREGSLASNCVFVGNTSGTNGGGCAMTGSSNLVADCIISGNVAGTTAGGIVVSSGSVLRNSIICCNRAKANQNYAGGGVYMQHTNSLMLNCLVYGNEAPNGGGGGVCMLHDADIDACTIVSNSAGVAGGGIYTYWASSIGDARLFIRNSIVYSNAAPDGPNWSGFNTQYTWFTNSCITNPTMPQGSGNITAYPEFIDPVANNYRLADGSPCINAGLNQEWMTDDVDLDGRQRLDRFTRQVDMGCYEYVWRGTMFNLK